MNNREVDLLICRARRAYVRRYGNNAPAPVINDSDIEMREGRDWIVLRQGEETLAEFMLRPNGDLRFMAEGRYGAG